MQTITPESGIVVRRAADHIDGREYYRQIRSIRVTHLAHDENMGSRRVITQMGESGELLKIELLQCCADFEVDTRGYLCLSEPDDLRHARVVDVSAIPGRIYRNKNMLRIRMPGITETARFTLCLLLNEIFRTIYPQAFHYIVALTPLPEIQPGYMKYALYHADYDADAADDDAYIDFIEDSELDLGLVVSVERNIERFFGIICEVLMWHKEKMAMPLKPEKGEPQTHEALSAPEKPQQQTEEKKGFFARIAAAFRRLFGYKEPEEQTFDDTASAEPESAKSIDEKRYDSLRKRLKRERERWYRENGFLHYGSKEIPECLDIDGTIEYLSAHGYNENSLHAVRMSAKRK